MGLSSVSEPVSDLSDSRRKYQSVNVRVLFLILAFSRTLSAQDEIKPLVFPASLPATSPFFQDTFIGVALLNGSPTSNSVLISGTDAAGNAEEKVPLGSSLPPRGQQAFLTSEVAGLEPGAVALLAEGTNGPIQGFFMVGDYDLNRLDGIGGKLEESKTLYFPIARHITQIAPVKVFGFRETTLLFLSNPAQVSSPNVRLRLFNRDGILRREIFRTIAASGSLVGTIDWILGFDLTVTEGYIEVTSSVPLKGLELYARDDYFSALPAQLPRRNYRLMVPHFFADSQGGNTEVRLLNVDSQKVLVKITASDNSANLLATEELEILPQTLLVANVTDLLDLDLALQQSGVISGQLELEMSRAVPSIFDPEVVGAVSFLPAGERSHSTLPMIVEGRTETVLLHVAQSVADNIFTGLSVSNMETETAQVRVEAFADRGEKTAETEFELEPGHRRVGLLSEAKFFGSTFSQIKGHLRISSDVPVGAFALFGDYTFEYLSAIEGQDPAEVGYSVKSQIGPGGGTISSLGLTATISPGTLAKETILVLESLSWGDAEDVLNLDLSEEGFTFLQGFSLESGNAQYLNPVQISTDNLLGLPPDAQVLIAQTVPDVSGDGDPDLLFLDVGVIGGETIESFSSSPVPGVQGDGQFLLLQETTPLLLVVGQVTNIDGSPAGNAAATSFELPKIFAQTDSSGNYALPVPFLPLITLTAADSTLTYFGLEGQTLPSTIPRARQLLQAKPFPGQ